MSTSRPRPQSLFGLLVHLAWLRRRVVVPVFTASLVMLAAVATRTCPRPDAPVRVATFNIRFFPESPQQVQGAFALIRELDVPIVAVQEITEPRAFAEAAADLLGPSWKAEFGPWRREERPLMPGLLYDSRLFQVDSARLHMQTRIEGVGRPMLEVRLFSREQGNTLRVFVVHLKAGGEPPDHEIRLAQLEVITPILRRAAASGDDVVILGDFNATGPEDRTALRTFARETKLHWASEDLACTAYWMPEKKSCNGSALDHVFTSEPARDVAARGPCESVGCAPGESCPIFYDQVSDHCPVTASF